MLQSMLHRKKATVKELQSLAGFLNFLNHAITPGHTFTRRMYSKFSGLVDANGNKIQHSTLKPHRHVRLDGEFKVDCLVWTKFLESSERGICRPFVDVNSWTSVETLDFYTDAAKGKLLGADGVFGSRWFFLKWENKFIETEDPSIEYLELYGFCVAVYIWTPHLLRNRRIVIFCDNQAVVNMVNNTAAKCMNCMVLIRLLVLRCLQFNVRIFCRWVKDLTMSGQIC